MAQQPDLLARLGLAAYNAMAATTAPATVLRLALQHWRGEEPLDTTLERLGVANVRRPKGPLVWFHAVTVAECAVALPVVFRCLLEYNENVHVLLTTGTPEAHALLAGSLPRRLVLRHAPFENPASVAAFLRAWRPQVGVFVESPSWPLLVEAAGAAGLRLALLNARMSTRWFRRNFGHSPARAMAGRVLSRFTLIVPQSDVDVGRFRILGATMRQMPGWCSDLKYAAALGTSVWHAWRPSAARILALRRALAGRPVWVAANTHDGEEELIGGVHASLKKEWPGILTILAPRQPSRAAEVAATLRSARGLRVAVWSSGGGERGGNAASPLRPPPVQGIDVLLLEAAADLPLAYCVAEVAFIGNSLLEGCTGHNLAEAAVAGCAVVVGEHAGHFGQMAEELNQAAVMAAEEAAAAVNSSSALLDDSYPFHSQHEAAAAAGEEAAFAGPDDGTEASPREPGSHWGSLLEDMPYRPSSGRESAGGGSRPATAPAAVAYSRDHRAPFALASPSAAARGHGPAAEDSTAVSPSAAAAADSGFDCASPLGSAGGSGVFDSGSPSAAHMFVSPLRRRALVDSGDGSAPPPVPPVPPPTMGTNTPAGEEDGGASPIGGRSWAGGAAAAAAATAMAAAAAGRGLPPRGGAAAAAAAAVAMATARRGSGAGAGLEVGGQQQDGSGAAIDEPSAEGWLGLATVAAAASADEGADGGPFAEQGAGLPPLVPSQQQQPQQQSGRGAAQGPGVQISGAIKRSHGGRAGGPGDGSSVDNSRSNSYANTPRCFPMTPVTPTTPHATPDDSAHAMGGRSPHMGSSANSGPGAPPFGLPASAAALTQALRWPNGPAARSGSGSGGTASGAGSGGAASGHGAAAAAGAPNSGGGPPLWPCVRPLAADEGSEPGTPLHVYGVPPPPSQGAAQQQHGAAAGVSAAAAAALGVGRGSYDGGRPDSPVPNRGPLQRGSEGGTSGPFLVDSAAFGLGRCSSDGCIGMGPGSEDSVPLGRCPTVGELIRLRGASDAGGSGGGRPMRVSELGLTSTSSEGGPGAGRGGGSGAGSSGGGAGGRQPVDLYPGEAPCAVGEAEALERQGSMGWEGWREDAAAAAQQQQQQQQQGRTAAPRGGRSRLSGGGDTADPSPLGDPGRAAHFMDGGSWWQQQQQVAEGVAGVQDRPPTLSRLNVSHHHHQQQRHHLNHQQPGSRGDGSAPPTQPGTASSIGLGSSAAQHQAWRGLGLLGGEAQSPTSLSGYSPRSTLSDGQTPSWARQTPQSAHGTADGNHPWRSYSGSSVPASSAPPPVRHSTRRQPSGYTPRLPRHDESDAGGSDTPGSLADAGYGPDSRRLLGRASGDSPSVAGGPTGGGSVAGAAGFTDGRLGGGGGGGPVARASSVGGASVCGIPPVPAGGGGMYGGAGTSYMRYAGDYILPATHLPYSPQGPAVWQVSGAEGLASAVATLLREPLERRSRGHAAAQGAAKLASGLVSTVWHVLDDMVVAPGLNEYLAATRPPGDHPHAAAAGARAGARR